MTLISILLAWLLVHYTTLPVVLQRSQWFDNYIATIEPLFQKISNKMELRFSVIIVLPLIIAWLILSLLHHIGGHIGVLIFNILIVIYCWPMSVATATASTYQSSARTTFWQALHYPFVIIFLFVVFGPLGALLYDMLKRSSKHAYAPMAFFIQNMLDWPAARLLGFGYALAGHFHPAFSYWSAHLFNDSKYNQLFLEECGLHALQGNSDDNISANDKLSHHAQALVKRAQVMLLIALALYTLGSWLY